MGALDAETRATRAMARCDVIAAFTTEPGRITRPYGSLALVQARDTIAEWMEQCGLATRVDAIGTLRGLYPGDDPVARKLLIGSHIDSVRDAGRFDGVLGVMIAIAALEDQGGDHRLPFPVEIVAFPDEEGLRFQTTYLGSAALAGAFDPAWLDLTDDDGSTLREAVLQCGGDSTRVADAKLQPDEAFAYLEAHIEQGPRLEATGCALGAVTAISGQTRINVRFTGEAGHAGTVPMAMRRDPAPAAAALVLAAESLAHKTPELLATVGRIATDPGASNVIPGSVALTLDVRHPLDEVRTDAVKALHHLATELAMTRGLDLDWRIMRDHSATPCDPTLTVMIQRAAADAMGAPAPALPSGAGHDAVTMAEAVPAGMMFVRCRGGISHNPAESVSVEDVATAIRALDNILDRLADEARGQEPSR
ncbi:MAG: allantoate amidohydrolase [Chloroflexota bacterium]|nr:allantoate amidohydrolase [Chloroflexota bacterium]